MDAPADSIRIDLWLWHARFFKTRSQCAARVSAGHVRVNGNRVLKPAFRVYPGHVLTIVQGRGVRAVEVVSPGNRRGPAAEARSLYREIPPGAFPAGARDRDGGIRAVRGQRPKDDIA